MSGDLGPAPGADFAAGQRAPWWLPGGHAQTIWAARHARAFDHLPPRWRRERWTTPDQDFIDVDFLDPPPAGADRAPLLVLFHGLEGSSESGYAQAFACIARQAGWRYAVPHFRGCSGELNLAPRAYHSGDHAEVEWILARLAAGGAAPMVVVGISLGGNMLMRWAEEAGTTAASRVAALAAVCSPLDLAAGGQAIGRGFGRYTYTRMFLSTMKTKALAKLRQYPGLFDEQRLRAARDLYEFDNVFTAPLHGFRDTDDYWKRASAKPRLADIRVPALALNARNDPFVPASSLPLPGEVGRFVTLWQPGHGGHVGFTSGAFPGHVLAMPAAVSGWLARHLPAAT